MELTEPVHSREHLAYRLIDITDYFEVTGSVFTISRDNASSNDVILREFEAEASLLQIDGPNHLEQPWAFTQKEDDVRYKVYNQPCCSSGFDRT